MTAPPPGFWHHYANQYRRACEVAAVLAENGPEVSEASAAILNGDPDRLLMLALAALVGASAAASGYVPVQRLRTGEPDELRGSAVVARLLAAYATDAVSGAADADSPVSLGHAASEFARLADSLAPDQVQQACVGLAEIAADTVVMDHGGDGDGAAATLRRMGDHMSGPRLAAQFGHDRRADKAPLNLQTGDEKWGAGSAGERAGSG